LQANAPLTEETLLGIYKEAYELTKTALAK
jgi:hypothetical protein